MCAIKLKGSFLLFSVILQCYVCSIYAQDQSNTIGRVSIASPTAASLGKYGDIPVNYHSGLPQIAIPIYTVEAGSLKLPISLSYHASGLKVEEQASWVGAGWSLNAGGVLTRTVVGVPDDKGYNSPFITNGYYADYGYQSYMMTAAAGGVLPDGKGTDDINFLQGYKDGEPDLFFFNIGGYSGKFYFNDDRTPVIVPEQDIKIQTDYTAGTGFTGFTLTTPDGVKYYFGKTGNGTLPDPIEITTPATVQNGYGSANNAISSWYLNKIESADGIDVITLQYVSETYSYYNWSMFPISNFQTGATPSSQLNGFDFVKNFVNGIRLSQINFPNGTVKFTPSATPRTDLTAGYTSQSGLIDQANTNSYSLGSITISNNNNGYCKKDSFYYSYFVDNTNANSIHNTYLGTGLDVYNLQSDKYALRLDSMQEMACDNTIKIPPHKFSYFSETVPRKLSLGIDHWGFSNGITTNAGLIPAHTVQYQGLISQIAGANRDAAWPAMRGGSLQKITYPTGGFTQLDFEAHNTYCSYNTYTTSGLAAVTFGYGSSTTPVSFSFTCNTANTLQITITSNETTSSGMPETGTVKIIRQSDGVTVMNWDIVRHGVVTGNFVLPTGNYFLKIYEDFYDGMGVNASITELVPTPVQSNVTVGGLRIKTVTTNDGLSPQNIVTNYSYTVGNVPTAASSGILYSKPIYVKLVKNAIFNVIVPYAMPNPSCQVLLCATPSGGSCAFASQQYYKSPTSVRPMETTQGGHIGYNEVYVTQANNGYTVYRYYGSNLWDNVISDVCTRFVNWDNVCDASIPNTPAAPVPFEFMRGQLKYEGYFNQDGKLLKDVWHYPVFQPSLLITPGYITSNENNNQIYVEYYLQSGRKVSDSTEETSYDPVTNSYVTIKKATYFGSPYHHQQTRQSTYASNGDNLATNIKYAFDFRVAACDALDNAIATFTTNAAQDTATFQNTLGTCTPQGPGVPINTSCRYKALQQIREDISNHRIQYITTRKNNFTNTSNLFDQNHLTAKNGASTELKPIYELQDANQHFAIEQTQFRNVNLLNSNFTRYDYVTTPTGKVYPNKTQLISLQAPSATFTNAAVSGTTIVKDSRYLDESIYVFNTGNPQQVTPHDGITNAYIWDYLNTLPIAKATNTTVDQIAFTSFEADGKGGWTFTGTPATDAASITGKKDYGLPSGNITKTGLNTGKSFIVSYWSKSASATVNGVTASAVIAKNGWTYYEHKLAAGISSVTVSGSVTIDELRLYPSDAQMTTYTYTPVMGMSTSCDVDNRISYYVYDGIGRLRWIKDQDGNVVKTIQYHYANQTTAQ